MPYDHIHSSSINPLPASFLTDTLVYHEKEKIMYPEHAAVLCSSNKKSLPGGLRMFMAASFIKAKNWETRVLKLCYVHILVALSVIKGTH